MSYSTGNGRDYAGMYSRGESVYGELVNAAGGYSVGGSGYSAGVRSQCPTAGQCRRCSGRCKVMAA